jgi:small subunit ribosomal protein S13
MKISNTKEVKIMGVGVPASKQVHCSLTYIHGIGRFLSKKICDLCNIDYSIRTYLLTPEQLENVRKVIVDLNLKIEGDLKREVSANIKRLIIIKCYRGNRHSRGLPVRGQRSKTNARTRKGKRKK